MENVGQGNYPDLLHMYDNEAQIIYIKNKLMYGQITDTPLGEWDNREFEDEIKILNLEELSHFEINKLGGFGAVGVVKSGDSHKLLIYEFQHDVSEYLSSGNIKHSIENPISTFSLSLENAKHPNPEHEGNIAMSEKNNLINPGSKVIFKFGMGEEMEQYEMGTFYVDRGNFALLNDTADIDGRNLIGKALKDQTLNENHYTGYNNITTIITNLFNKSDIRRWNYNIENTAVTRRFEFKPNDEVFKAVEEMLKAMINWKIEENEKGIISVGSPSFSGFASRGTYFFYRNKDIFSRQIIRDDRESYRKVCIHNNEFTRAVYKDVKSFTGWNLKSNKTLFVTVADGTSSADMQAIATEVASRLENTGKVETFTGPFRPQLLVGDGANIIDEDGVTSLGLITEITHNFGKGGFTTMFTVDSGGKLGRGRISDFISMVANKGTVGSIAYEDIIPDTPIESDLTEYIAILSAATQPNYTPESWVTYQAVVTANTMTVNNTQTQVDIATIRIQIAQGKLVLI